MKFQKSNILKALYAHQDGYIIPRLIDIYFAEFKSNSHLDLIRDNLFSKQLVVRSSSENEDGLETSNAGKYESVLNVNIEDDELISNALNQVFNSYEFADSSSRVLVQEMVVEPQVSGVLFTHELETSSPYYVINYDDISKKTDTVTSGNNKNSNMSLFVLRNKFDELKSNRFKKLIHAVRNIEGFLKTDHLDIEFAIDEDENIYIFQVRPITRVDTNAKSYNVKLNQALDSLRFFLKNKFTGNSFVSGKTTIYGQMPDWNPAEMIGSFPNNLAYSLYSYLITDNVWAIARERMLYKSMSGYPLMIKIAGRPYIDCRLSFNSFLPQDLDSNLGITLVDIWMDKLKENPNHHDKIEFDIAITCYTFDIEETLNRPEYGAISTESKSVYIQTLKNHLNYNLDEESLGSIDTALAQVGRLINLQNTHAELEFKDLKYIADNCKDYGTIPFSVLARHGFIAKSLMQSLVNIGIITETDFDSVMNSIKTVSTDFVTDLELLNSGKLSIKEFITNYGHLRPGTYDLTSKSYREMLELFKVQKHNKRKHADYILSKPKRDRITQLLIEHNIDIDYEGFMRYIKMAIQGREFGKFIFTKNIDKMLSLISDFGSRHGVDNEDLINLSITDYFDLNNIFSTDNVRDYINRKSFHIDYESKVLEKIKLPSLITEDTNLNVIPFQINSPNFITQNEVIAPILKLDGTNSNTITLDGKIIVIEGADPGYDWIFGHKIKGLITKYGGANSHMSIRCSEFNLPAAIGCGEILYKKICEVELIGLDCRTKKITF